MKQSLNDGKFEVFAVTSSFHIAQLQVAFWFFFVWTNLLVQVGLSTPIHIAQARKAVLKVVQGHLPMQSDGEAWLQSPAAITITHKGVSQMLEKVLKFPTGRAGFF